MLTGSSNATACTWMYLCQQTDNIHLADTCIISTALCPVCIRFRAKNLFTLNINDELETSVSMLLSNLINWCYKPVLEWLAWFIMKSKQFNQSEISLVTFVAVLMLMLRVNRPLCMSCFKDGFGCTHTSSTGRHWGRYMHTPHRSWWVSSTPSTVCLLLSSVWTHPCNSIQQMLLFWRDLSTLFTTNHFWNLSAYFLQPMQ